MTIRPATLDDLEAVEAICADDPDDYVPEVFPAWIAEPGDYTFIVELDGRPAGFANAKMLSAWEAWGQGVRVHPAMRRHGVGRAITAHWPTVMREHHGATAAMIATNARNLPSIRMHAQGGFEIVARTSARRWTGQRLRHPAGLPAVRPARAGEQGALWARVQASAPLAAHGHVVRGPHHFHHVTAREIAQAVADGRMLTAGDAWAWYVVRPAWDGSSRIGIVVAADGPSEGIQAIALHLVERAPHEGWPRVVFDGRKDTPPVAAVEAIGFEPPEDWGEMLIMQKGLEPAPRA